MLRREELRGDQSGVDLIDSRIAILILASYEQFPGECQTLLKELACLPCDGDIVSSCSLSQGTGFRRGVCPQVCNRLHSSCAEAFFYTEVNSQTAKQISVCRKDSLICAKLKDISPSPSETCKLFGLEINSKVSRDEDFTLKVMSNLSISEDENRGEAVCHDLKSSYSLYGRSKILQRRAQHSELTILLQTSLITVILAMISG